MIIQEKVKIDLYEWNLGTQRTVYDALNVPRNGIEYQRYTA